MLQHDYKVKCLHNIGPSGFQNKKLMKLHEEKRVRNSLFVGSHASTMELWSELLFLGTNVLSSIVIIIIVAL